MKVTIDFDDCEIQPALQLHLSKGYSVQGYVKAALGYFNDMLNAEKGGQKKCGYGDASRFGSYNTEVSPHARLGFKAPIKEDD